MFLKSKSSNFLFASPSSVKYCGRQVKYKLATFVMYDRQVMYKYVISCRVLEYIVTWTQPCYANRGEVNRFNCTPSNL